MFKRSKTIFGENSSKQVKKLSKDKKTKQIITRLLDKLELSAGSVGRLIDSKKSIYEIKNKRPPLRIYYKINTEENIINILEVELKTSEKKQKKTIKRLKYLNLLWYKLHLS